GVNEEADRALANDTTDAGGVLLAGPAEHTVKRPEEPTERRVHDAGEPVFARVGVLEQHGAERRRKRQGVERGDHRANGDGDGEGELPGELSGETADERHRYQYSAEDERGRDDRSGDFIHSAPGGGERRQA